LPALAGISAVETCALDVDGELIELDGRLVARVNETAPPRRRRFTLAHEIAHALLLPLTGDPRRQLTCGRQVELERLCDAVAAELLIPWAAIKRWLDNYTLNDARTDIVLNTANTFQVSLQATALRLTEVTRWCSAVALFEQIPNRENTLMSWSVGKMRIPSDDAEILDLVRNTYSSDKNYNKHVIMQQSWSNRVMIVEMQRLLSNDSFKTLMLMRNP
jgi:Zn-dependent peptidase ImmA (M78 family)